jgi:ketosteroid isomerase-like protein
MLRRLARLCGTFAVAVPLAMAFAATGCQSSGSNHEGSGAASSSADARQEIATLHDQYTQALLNKDVAALDRIWADDLTFVNPRGELLGKQERMENIRTGATAFKSIRVSEQVIRTHGQAGVATVKVAADAQYSGQQSSGEYRVTTVWARRNGTWQMVAVHMTPIAR